MIGNIPAPVWTKHFDAQPFTLLWRHEQVFVLCGRAERIGMRVLEQQQAILPVRAEFAAFVCQPVLQFPRLLIGYAP
jgi:hypothetical protein